MITPSACSHKQIYKDNDSLRPDALSSMYFGSQGADSLNSNDKPLNDIKAWTLKDKGEKSFVFDLDSQSSKNQAKAGQPPTLSRRTENTTSSHRIRRRPFSSLSSNRATKLDTVSTIETAEPDKLKQWKVCLCI